jgi:hypothetical protein
MRFDSKDRASFPILSCMPGQERDQWSECLRCPNCGATGRAFLSQANPASHSYHDGTDQNVRVEFVPIGFKSVVTEFGCEFYCAECGVLALLSGG